MSNSCDSWHRLASHSRKRRRIVLEQSQLHLRNAARSRESAAFSLRSTEPSSTDLDGAPQTAGFEAIRELIDGRKPLTWVFAGDGITQGGAHTGGERNYCEHFGARIRGHLCRHDDVVINTSVPDETSQSLLEDLEWRTLRFRPDVVCVMVGINDAMAGSIGPTEFRRNLQKVVECIRADGGIALLQTPPRVDLTRVNARVDPRTHVRVLRDMSRALDLPCVDHWAAWTQAASEHKTGAWLADDGIHPTAEGHRVLAKLIFSRLGIVSETVRR